MEIEFRWLIREWETWPGYLKVVTDKPVLQVRRKDVSKGEDLKDDWEDIPTVIERIE